MRVLLIDTAPTDREVTRRFLSSVGHDVRSCSSLEDFLIATTDFSPDIALVDLEMTTLSETNRLEILAAHLRANRIRIVLHSSKPLGDVQGTVLRAGAHAYIQKTADGGTFYAAFCAAAGIIPTPTVAPPASSTADNAPELPSELRLDIPWIDAQHAFLYSLYTRYAKTAPQASRHETDVLIGLLERYASFHFAAEESLLPANDPATIRHRREHVKFFSDVRRFHHAMDQPDHAVATPDRVVAFVGHWITSHINGSDRSLRV